MKEGALKFIIWAVCTYNTRCNYFCFQEAHVNLCEGAALVDIPFHC